MKKVNVGIIGVGNMGKNHARIYSEIANLVSISDIDEHLGSEMSTKYHAKFYNDYKKMLKDNQLDAISVVVPTFLHKKVVFECLKYQLPTFVEKPIATNLSDAHSMLKYAKKQQTLLMVGHVERFNPAIIKLKKIIDEGRLGKIINLLAIRVGIAPPNPSASDVALDLGIHDVDIFNYLLGKFPDRKKIVKTKLFSKNAADSSIILLEYGKITATIQTNWITPVKTRKLFISATNGYVELDYIRQKFTIYEKHIKVRKLGSFLEFVSLMNNPKKEIFISKKEPLKEELKFFLANINNLDSNNLRDSIEALKIVS